MTLSPNAQVILLLTAPLIAGRGKPSGDVLTPGEYKRLARTLRNKQRQPADLLTTDAGELLGEDHSPIDRSRLRRLLERGFLLSQAVERWETRAIWVVSRADSEYPKRLKERLKDDAPPVLYGCGSRGILNTSGLAVVGSRHVDDSLLDYTEAIGRLAAKAGRTIISGGARGIDQAAMRGALDEGGNVVGVLSDSLERTALNREHRNLLLEDRLVLISPYDPSAGFNVGHAMQRNKVVYALADAALVVSSDYETGGTWAGAVEQLERMRFVPVYVRSHDGGDKALEALRRKGALHWPDPTSAADLVATLSGQARQDSMVQGQKQLSFSTVKEYAQEYEASGKSRRSQSPRSRPLTKSTKSAEELFATVRSLLEQMNTPKTDADVAAELNVHKIQAKDWLERLVRERVLEKLTRPVRYRAAAPRPPQTSLL
jgi:DNA processing protein